MKFHRKNHFNSKLISVVILCNVILCAVTSCLFKFNSDTYVTIYKYSSVMRKEREWACIELYIKELYLRFSVNMDNLSIVAEDKIKQEYPDLSDLEFELKNKNYRGLYNVISPLVEDRFFSTVENDRNDIFIATKEGIFANYSLSDMPYNNPNTYQTIESWEDYINRSTNKELARKSIDLILNQSNDIIFNENSNFTMSKEGHIEILEPMLSEMKKVYMNEGIDGLKNYTFLVPSYITNKGDIFGNKDIIYGYRCNTYKIILVQEFNIYDQITYNYPAILDQSSYQVVDVNYKMLIKLSDTIGLFIIGEMVTCIILSCILFNNKMNKCNSDKIENKK